MIMTIANKTDFRGSEVTEFLRCAKRYDYRWVQELEPKQANEKLTIGSAIHKFLEVWYATGSQLGAFTALEAYMQEQSASMDEVTYSEAVTLIAEVCDHYIAHYGKENWKVIAAEMPFRIHLEGSIYYTGTIDMLVQDQDGKYWIVDHKTTNSLDIFDKNSDMDRQISRYWYAIERYMDINIQGFIYNIILKDYPQPPKVLKSGALSKDKAQKTTYQLYQQAIVDNNLKEEDYADFLQLLQDQPKEFFRRINVERNISEMRASISELTDVIFDIRDKHKNRRWYRNITKDCHWDCPYRTLCVAEMDGSNADHIRNELYQVKDDEE